MVLSTASRAPHSEHFSLAWNSRRSSFPDACTTSVPLGHSVGQIYEISRQLCEWRLRMTGVDHQIRSPKAKMR